MRAITRRCGDWLVGAGVGLAALSILFTVVPNFGRNPRRSDVPHSRRASGLFRALSIRGESAAERPVFKPETKANLTPVPSGICATGGTPTTITMQTSEHGPIQLISKAQDLGFWRNDPQSVIWVPTDERPHSKDPDITFAGESDGHGRATRWSWTPSGSTTNENISGEANTWIHSDKEHVIQRFSRPFKSPQLWVTIEDPIVLAKPSLRLPCVGLWYKPPRISGR